MPDYDARLVELYDEDNPDGPDHDYFRALADDLGARSVLDLGCGTGLLTVSFAREGRAVVGVDPSTTMLEHATGRAGANRVRWVHGDSRNIPDDDFDLAVMTGNVAQHIPDPDWQRTLIDLHRAVRPSGVLAFESRNPTARAWEAWAADKPTTRPTCHGPLREWLEVTQPHPSEVLLIAHNLFEAAGEDVIVEQKLLFRDRSLIEEQLRAAGFAIDNVWGDWHRSPFTDTAPVMVFEAHRLDVPEITTDMRSHAQRGQLSTGDRGSDFKRR